MAGGILIPFVSLCIVPIAIPKISKFIQFTKGRFVNLVNRRLFTSKLDPEWLAYYAATAKNNVGRHTKNVVSYIVPSKLNSILNVSSNSATLQGTP